MANLKHEVVRVDNLMYNGCEAHWKCLHCGTYVPFHCYTKAQLEQMPCPQRHAFCPKQVQITLDEKELMLLGLCNDASKEEITDAIHAMIAEASKS